MGYKLGVSVFCLLLVCTSVSAVWEAQSTEWLAENNVVVAKGLNVRVTDIDVEDRVAQVIIKDGARTVYEGPLTALDGYTRADFVRVTAGDFRYYDPARPEVMLKVEEWRAVKIVNMNFPEEIYKNDAYKVFIAISNPTSSSKTYNVELANEGVLHVEPSSKDANVDFSSNVKSTIQSSTQEVSIPAGKSEKVYFKVQPAGHDRLGKVVMPVFRLRSESGTLIREEPVGEVPVVGNQVVFIEDIVAPVGILAGTEERVEVRFRNSWISASNDFRVELIAPEFKIVNDARRQLRAFPGRTEIETFNIIPYGGGVFTVTAEVYLGRNLMDTFSVEIPVIGEKVYAITDVEVPEEMEPGETEPIFVTIKNRGPSTNTLSVAVESDDFRLQSPEAVVRLGAGDDTRVLFNIEADTERTKAGLKVSLYDLPEKYLQETYNINYKLADRKEMAVDINQPVVVVDEPEEPVVDEPVEEEIEEQLETEDNESEDDTTVVPIPVESNDYMDRFEDFWPYIAIGVLVLIAVVLIIIGEKRKKPKVDVYDID